MKKSKCEKAARSAYKKLWPESASEVAFQHFHRDFIKGAEALLRYAKRKAEFMTLPADHIRLNAITTQLLEQWVKGEE